MANTTIKLSIGDVDEPRQVMIVIGFHKYTRDANSPLFKFPESKKCKHKTSQSQFIVTDKPRIHTHTHTHTYKEVISVEIMSKLVIKYIRISQKN